MSNIKDSIVTMVHNLLEEGKGREHIESMLLEGGHDEGTVREVVATTIKLRNETRRNQAVTWIIIGAFLCLVSCLVTLCSASTTSMPYVLYGLTSVGILIIFAGFSRIF